MHWLVQKLHYALRLTILIGFNLLQIALTEAQKNQVQDQAFSRQVHIDALIYLLRGLPNDLTEQEAHQIRNAVPQKEGVWINRLGTKPRPNPSLLHRGLASIIILACVFLRFILPYIKHCFNNAYRFERNHQLSERLLAFGVSSVDSLGKRGIELVNNALGHEFVTNSMLYCIEGVHGGLTEGLGEGLKCIEAAQAP